MPVPIPVYLQSLLQHPFVCPTLFVISSAHTFPPLTSSPCGVEHLADLHEEFATSLGRDFDPDAWDKRMAEVFDDDYYAADDGEWAADGDDDDYDADACRLHSGGSDVFSEHSNQIR